MRTKLCVFALLVILATPMLSIQEAKASNPLVSVSPATVAVLVGDSFAVDVNLDYATNLYGYEIWLSFDATKINVTGVEYKNYLNEPTQIWSNQVNNTGGYVDFAVSSLRPAPAKTGGSPPPLATIHFTAKALGTSTLHLSPTKTILVDNQGIQVPIQTSDGLVTAQPAGGSPQPVASEVDIYGYALMFQETMMNMLDSQVAIDYYWSFTVDKWNGASWVSTTISGSSSPVAGYVISALATVNLPLYSYILPASGSNALKWCDWLRISFTFHWTYSGSNYSVDYVAKVHVHPGDVNGDGVCDISDGAQIGLWWFKSVPPAPIRVDINGDKIVDISDAVFVGINWQKSWTNTPP